MAMLHGAWNQISTDYDRLWNHAYDEDAEHQLDEIFGQEREASGLAADGCPYNPKTLGAVAEARFASYRLPTEDTAVEVLAPSIARPNVHDGQTVPYEDHR